MKSKIKRGLFWLSVLLCLLVGVNVWPARVALGPQGVASEEEHFAALPVKSCAQCHREPYKTQKPGKARAKHPPER